MKAEIRAVQVVRSLGGDTTEEFEAFLEKRRERRFVSVAIDDLFAANGWV